MAQDPRCTPTNRAAAPPRTLRSLTLPWIAVVFAFLAATGCAAEETSDGATTEPTAETSERATNTDEAAPVAPTTEETQAASGTAPAARSAEIRGVLPIGEGELSTMLAFVEDATGREFQRPPVIVVQSPEDFAAGLIADPTDPDELAEQAEDAEVIARTYQVLGLADLTPDEFLSAVEEFQTSEAGVLGYYDPEVDELYVPSQGEADDAFRSTLVHELVHALDGQYSDLDALLEAADDDPADSAFGLVSVVEGRATIVQNAYVEESGLDVPVDLEAELPDVPIPYIMGVALPYQLGPVLVDAAGGVGASERLLDGPHPTSEQVVFPDRFLAEDQPIEVAAPDPVGDGEVIDSGTFGAVSYLLWLGGDGLLTGVGLDRAMAAAEGWGGDAFVLTGDDEQTCFALTAVGDSDRDSSQIATAVEGWAAEAPGRSSSVDADGSVRVEACSPWIG